jgi:hypothetical protein
MKPLILILTASKPESNSLLWAEKSHYNPTTCSVGWLDFWLFYILNFRQADIRCTPCKSVKNRKIIIGSVNLYWGYVL